MRRAVWKSCAKMVEKLPANRRKLGSCGNFVANPIYLQRHIYFVLFNAD